jgi:hypothetical protein
MCSAVIALSTFSVVNAAENQEDAVAEAKSAATDQGIKLVEIARTLGEAPQQAR